MPGRQTLADRFELGEAAGSGGMGTIYRALDRESGQLVAVKLLAANDDIDVDRFTREADVLGTLSHPNIVRYISRGISDQGQRYLVMQWIEGESLFKKLAHEGVTIREAVSIAQQTAAALAESHRHGVIHRDVKPDNVMLEGDAIDRVRIVDFGLARFVFDDHRLTRTGTAMGTPGYMSPEQARGSRELDGRADVFALGCLLYECIAGFAPFSGENVMALQIKVLMYDPPPLTTVRADTPAVLGDIVQRMLAKQLDDRPQMDEVARELAALSNIPEGERRVVGDEAPGTRKIGAVDRAPAAPWMVMASPKRPKNDWPERARTAAARWRQHELTRDHALVIRLASPGDAATCALEIARVLADATVVITAPTSVEDTIDRSTRVLSVAALRSIFAKGAAAGHVYLDDMTAKALGTHFDVVLEGDTYVLRGAR